MSPGRRSYPTGFIRTFSRLSSRMIGMEKKTHWIIVFLGSHIALSSRGVRSKSFC